jgi:chemotaxis protein CheC
MLVFSPQSAQNLVSALTGEEPGSPELDSVTVETLSEVGNIIINSVMGTITNFINQRIDCSVPHFAEDAIHKLIALHIDGPEYSILEAKAKFIVEDLEVEGEIILIFGMGSFDTLLNAIDLL